MQERYIKDRKTYRELVDNLKDKFGTLMLGPEYSYFVHQDLLRFLIRLARYKFVARMLQKTDVVLEIGCGSGLGTIFLSQFCRKVEGIDVNKEEIERARLINTRDNVEFKIIDYFDYNPSEKYNVIVALDVIEHMNKKLGKKLLLKTVQHIKENGMCILGTPTIYSYPYQSKLSRASHIKLYNEKELRLLTKQFYTRCLLFSMNDEVVHTGSPKMAWYYFLLAFYPKAKKNENSLS